uniref:Uncharacterized protein n=1 Tax=Anguilla anguilla TaxID=7936 RepID=A0A0E9PNE8_ANGAN
MHGRFDLNAVTAYSFYSQYNCVAVINTVPHLQVWHSSG